MPDTGQNPDADQTPQTAPFAARFSTRRVLYWMLGLQLGIAGLMVFSNALPALVALFQTSDAAPITEPAQPGDQTRRYDPARITRPAPDPARRPLRDTPDMPDRLAFDIATFNDAPALLITGRIADGDGDRFADFAQQLGDRGTDMPQQVFLNSPGGSVYDALSIGRALRGFRVATTVAGSDICLSACPLLLAAGQPRQADDSALVGVHQTYFGENTVLPAFMAVREIQFGQSEVLGYLSDMGVDLLLLQPALLTPPEDIYLLTPDELTQYRLVSDDLPPEPLPE